MTHALVALFVAAVCGYLLVLTNDDVGPVR